MTKSNSNVMSFFLLFIDSRKEYMVSPILNLSKYDESSREPFTWLNSLGKNTWTPCNKKEIIIGLLIALNLQHGVPLAGGDGRLLPEGRGSAPRDPEPDLPRNDAVHGAPVPRDSPAVHLPADRAVGAEFGLQMRTTAARL